MSGKNKSSNQSAQSIVAATPTPPPPASEYYYENGTLKGKRLYGTDNGLPLFRNEIYTTPDEQAIDTQSTSLLRGLMGNVGSAFNLSPASIDAYKTAYKTPQITAVNDAYNQAKGQALNSANAAGTLGSVGFNDYMANQLEKNRANSLANIESQAEMLGYDLPRRVLAPYQDAFNLYSAASQGQQATAAQQLEPVLNGNQISNNTLQGAYGNLLQLKQLQAQYAPEKYTNNGFFSRLFGG